MGKRALLAALVLAATTAMMAPSGAFGHAQLEASSPQRGEKLERPPEEIQLDFNEPVEASFGAVGLFDSEGEEVTTGGIERPADRQDALVIRPAKPLADGAYTVTYRVVSADSHPVAGGYVFSVGEQDEAAITVAQLLAEQGAACDLTKALLAADRVVSYAALAGMLGGLFFGFAVWRRQPRYGAVEPHFFDLLGRLMVISGLLLALVSLAGIVLQGAVASGSDIAGALRWPVIEETLATRYGETAALRVLAVLAFAALAAALCRRIPGGGAAAVCGLLGVLAAVTAASFGLGGHAGAASASLLTVPASLLHLVTMAGWFGGLGILVFLLPRVTRRLPAAERSGLLALLISRFSALALAAVALLAISGVAQALVHLGYLDELWQTRYGNLILLKLVLFGGLILLGAYNRWRLRPRLAEAAREGAPPGAAGRALRSALRAEVVLALGVLAASALLVSLAPASASEAVYSRTTRVGPAEAELVVDPPRVGPQEVHIYLFEAESGAQWDDFRRLSLTAREEARGIGPIEIDLHRAGPGHYLAGGDLIAMPGNWILRLDVRATRFDAYEADFEVRIR